MFTDLLPAPRPAIAARMGSCMQSVEPIATVVPSRIGHWSVRAPQVLLSAWFQTCSKGTLSSPRLTSLSGSLLMSVSVGCRRILMMSSAAWGRTQLSPANCWLTACCHS